MNGVTMGSARVAAIVTCAYAAGFGASSLPVAAYLKRTGKLPSFFGVFDMFAGPWFDRLSEERFLRLLLLFPAVTVVAAASGWDLWKGRRRGGVLNLGMLPIEAVFWKGFALPIPVAVGLLRGALVIVAWKDLGPASASST